MKRIIVSPSQFKISREGFDVDYATPDQIAFDAFSWVYTGVYMQGKSAVDGTWTSNQTGNVFLGVTQFTRLSKEIPFDKVFEQPPQVIYMLRQISNPAAGAYPRYSHVQSATNGIIGTVAWASASTTKLKLRVDYPTYGTGQGITDFEFSYVVFQR